MNFSNSIPEPNNELISRATEVRSSSIALSQSSDSERKAALLSMAASLSSQSNSIINSNIIDMEDAKKEGINSSLLARLKLDQFKLDQAIEGVRKVAELPDPLGISQLKRELSSGLTLKRVTVPLGVLGVIFEARPDALMQIASLAVRSGNGAILKGGKEASNTNKSIMDAMKEGLDGSVVSPSCITLLNTRAESLSLLKLDSLVDLIIPRGSNELVRYIQDNTRIPVLGHADGICHLYVDSDADLEQAINIAIDSKSQYPAACNSIETLLLHKDIAEPFLTRAIPIFESKGINLLGDKNCLSLGIKDLASDKDWATEYLDLILSIKIVNSLDEAINHIRKYSSRHTDSIVSKNNQSAKRFMASIDSSGVFHNCSTRFADGFRYGFGAEVGISTQTLPPRGPVGLDGLVTYRYFLKGDGHIVEDFNSGAKKFTHKDQL